MAFERPCLVFADLDGNMYDEPDLHMLCMDASGLSLPRPEEVTPLPPHCELVLLPGRYALGLDPETGEVAVHEGCAVAALVPSNYLVAGLPAAESDAQPPVLPSQAYAAVGFAHNRFYMAAKKIDDEPCYFQLKQASKKAIKAGNALCAKFPDNKLIHHLVTSCAQTNNCWAAQNFCQGKSEFLLPIVPFCPCDALKTPHSEKHQSFLPTAQEIFEVMLHHARSVKNPVISLGHPCNLGNNAKNIEALIEAFGLFRQNDTRTPLCLHLYDTSFIHNKQDATGRAESLSSEILTSEPCSKETLFYFLPLLAHAGLSDISYKISCLHSQLNAHKNSDIGKNICRDTYKAISRDTNTTNCNGELLEGRDTALHFVMKTAVSLGLKRTVHYEYFAGLSDTAEEVAKLVPLLKEYSIHYLRLSNYPCDPHQVVGHCKQMGIEEKLGPVMGIGNFLKHIKRECPETEIISATPCGSKG